MMRKQWLKVIVTLMCLAFLAVPALAQNLNDHVTDAQNLKGDMLVYPVYLANNGVETNMTVINTSNTVSCVAKVSIRSHHYSQDMLDFLIYLSPNDVFKGTLKLAGGKYVLTSTDGSMCIGTAPNCTCASVNAPLTYELAIPCDGVVDDGSYGYVLVIESWSDINNLLPREGDGTVAKSTICAAYWAQYQTRAILENETPNILTGYGELVFPGADYALYYATAFADYDNLAWLDVSAVTDIGENADNNLCEVEACLAKNNLAWPYYDNGAEFSIGVFNFPTKQSTCPPNPVAKGPFFQGTNYEPAYGLQVYDLEEHSVKKTCEVSPCPETEIMRLPEETNLVLMDSPFDEGWGRITFAQLTACADLDLNNITYTGAPIIPWACELTVDGLSLIPMAYDYGTITYNGRALGVGSYQKLAGTGGDVPPVDNCAADNLGACLTEAACTAVGGFWYNDTCNAEAEPAVPVCAGKAQADCTGDCVWQAFPTAECLLNCAQFGTEAACTAGLAGGCKWVSTPFGDSCAAK
ncbi:MAG: hypothetical protein JW781_08105 [Deltaproteobacteria bacterium]|nr:hypothetical protein [Candidatus Anaeroferrophillacea bacterium]